MLWSPESDTFGFNISLKERPPTRRGILSMVSSVYDPLGFIAPCTLPAKMLMQDLCRLQLPWDTDIPTKYMRRWQEWLNDLHQLSSFSLNRCFKPCDFKTPPVDTQLHHFSDASENGYGTASYIRFVNNHGEVHCGLIIGKARVTPLKQISIPRLELTAATVAVRVDSMLRRELQIDANSYFWTDSTSVLRYVNNKTARFHTFVANRVTVITEATRAEQWKYVPTNLNPADDCSRGISVKKFLNRSRWIRGPEFLWGPESQWPTNILEEESDVLDDPEIKRVTVNITQATEHQNPLDRLMQHYSSWYSLNRAIAWLMRLKEILWKQSMEGRPGSSSSKDKNAEGEEHVTDKLVMGPLTVKEVRQAEDVVIRYVQRTSFQEEMALLKMATPGINEMPNLKRSSTIHRLNPMVDDGILRVGGRLNRSAMPEESKHQAILPKKHPIVYLILQQIHGNKGHVGRNHMMAIFHQRFWVAGVNSAARKVIRKCVSCRKQRGTVCSQRMADLPADRVKPDDPPFTKVGIDFFGPFETKRGRSLLKRYGVMFTCLTTRAVHLEMADSLDTDSCINAIRRFVARRGQVTEIRSDNGTNFVGAEKELRREIQKWNQQKINDSLLKQDITWRFNPPTASHFGGVWERQIRTVRQVMTSIIREQALTDEGLRTLFCEVEAIVNSRPLTKTSEDPNDFEALTPNHLLLLKGKPDMPPTITSKNDQYARRRWRQVQYLADLFWRRWTKQYLPQLQVRQKWNRTEENVKVGDVVLVVNNTAPRNCWHMGRVVKTQPDGQGQVRSVEVKTKNGVFLRPVCKLIMLLEGDYIDSDRK